MKIKFYFPGDLTTGTLSGTVFRGIATYDTRGSKGMGVEYLGLRSLNFVLKGVKFSKGDLNQGGQVIVRNGYPVYFTAAFTPPPKSSVTTLAFGFGGPGIIGYATSGTAGTEFGAGTYEVIPSIPSFLLLKLRRFLQYIVD